MMDFTQPIPYTDMAERNAICAEAVANGYEMKHDDFTETGGLLTFALPQPKSDEELYQEQLVAEFNDAHLQIIDLIKAWPDMSKDDRVKAVNKAFPKILRWMLWKDGYLQLGVLE